MTTTVVAPARTRLLAGVLAAVVERGYAGATIADIVRHARTSKRTFYEHFEDKEACFLAAYADASGHVLGTTIAAATKELPPRERIAAAVRVYLAALAEQPDVTRAVLTEIQGVGEAGRALRRAEQHRFADELRLTAAVDRGSAITPELGIAVVGGIQELVVQWVETGKADRLTELVEPCTDLIAAVLLQD